jgi:hypothetical protein
MNKCRAIALLALGLASASPVNADILSITTTGFVTPSATCPPPPSPAFDCLLTASGTGIDALGTFGPWTFSSPFMLFSANPVSATEFHNGGTFSYDDSSPSNNDFFGTFSGVFDLATFTAIHTYVVTGGTGEFAVGRGFGTGIVQVNPLDLTYVERVSFAIPVPSTLVLLPLAVVVCTFARSRRREWRGRPGRV